MEESWYNILSLSFPEIKEQHAVKQKGTTSTRQKSREFNLVPRVFSLSNMAAAGEKTLAHSELKRSLIGAFHYAFIRALSLVHSFQNKDGYPLRAS